MKYIKEKEFNDFRINFKVLVETLNHNITDIRDDVKVFKDNSMTMFGEVKELKGQIKMSNKLLWVLVGIIGSIVAASILSTI